jgi:hypothetical protein
MKYAYSFHFMYQSFTISHLLGIDEVRFEFHVKYLFIIYHHDSELNFPGNVYCTPPNKNVEISCVSVEVKSRTTGLRK